MKRYFAISAIGADRPGIVADLSELVYECGCNLEDSSSTILENQFALLMLVSSTEEGARERLSAGCKRLEWEKRLAVFFSPLEGVAWRRTRGDGACWRLTAIGIDKAGIVCRVTRKLSEHGMNIERMETWTEPSADTGTPVFHMRVTLWSPPGLDEGRFRTELDALGSDLLVEILLEPLAEADLSRLR